jgi:hypothetical protein
MTLFLRSVLLLAVTLTSTTASSQSGGSLDGVLSWTGHGRVFQIGVDQQEILGVIEGVFYIENSQGALDDAFMECTIKQQINQADQTTSAEGNCVIVQGPQNNVFGSYHCKGVRGICRGKFTLTGGTGDFEEISGGSDILIRSPVVELSASVTDLEELEIANGMALFDGLEYRLGERKR